MGKFVETYQTLIVGGLGFLGVMATLWWNGHLQRKAEERRERQEARVLRTALIEELKQLKASLQATAESLAEYASTRSPEDGRRRGTAIPLVGRSDDVFRASFNKLGLLKRGELSAVFEAYFAVRTLTWRLRMLEESAEWRWRAGMDRPRPPLQPTRDHVSLPIEHYKTASEMHVQLVPTIDAAIDQFERVLSPQRRWPARILTWKRS